MILSDRQQLLTLQDIEQLEICQYFESINQAEFDRAASLFAEEGELVAPFTEPIVGRKAIASYLSEEAKGMKLSLQTGTLEVVDSDTQQINIKGKVQTSLFSVNVGWLFTLNQQQEIVTARIKLLASPQELLNLRDKVGK